jgi:hypothetical protein
VSATGTSGAGLSEALTIGGGTIVNEATGKIVSVQRAITVDDSNGGNAFAATAITNYGLIEGDNGEAIKITDSLADTLTNSGTIKGSVDLGGGDDTFNIFTGSSITRTIEAAETFIDNVDRMAFDNWEEHESAQSAPPMRELLYPRAKSARQTPQARRSG